MDENGRMSVKYQEQWQNLSKITLFCPCFTITVAINLFCLEEYEWNNWSVSCKSSTKLSGMIFYCTTLLSNLIHSSSATMLN
jgi:hypothetical protein